MPTGERHRSPQNTHIDLNIKDYPLQKGSFFKTNQMSKSFPTCLTSITKLYPLKSSKKNCRPQYVFCCITTYEMEM